MEIIRNKRDVWGDEVILGVAWDLLWVVAVAALLLLAGHAIVMAALAKRKAKPSAEGPKVRRHDAEYSLDCRPDTDICGHLPHYPRHLLAGFQVHAADAIRFCRTI